MPFLNRPSNPKTYRPKHPRRVPEVDRNTNQHKCDNGLRESGSCFRHKFIDTIASILGRETDKGHQISAQEKPDHRNTIASSVNQPNTVHRCCREKFIMSDAAKSISDERR